MTIRYLVLAAVLMSTVACASGGGAGETAARSPSYNRDVLTAEELAQRSYANMYDVVGALRPNWLRPPMGGAGMGSSAAAAPAVYVDGRRLGDTETLKQVSAQSVAIARYYSATEAQNRFGLSAMTPVIDLTTKGKAGQ